MKVYFLRLNLQEYWINDYLEKRGGGVRVVTMTKKEQGITFEDDD